MPTGEPTLHGNAPDSAPVALLLIDVINDFEFDGGEALFQRALSAARSIAALKQRAKALGIPVIYVNDNFGRWQSNFRELIEHCLHDDVRGEPITRLLLPDADDYFILKPKHSGFYQTALDILLTHLDAKTLILTGFAGDFCVLFTANDAYMRSYKLIVPGDCVASESEDYNRQALDLMTRVLKAQVVDSTAIDVEQLLNPISEKE